jgi:hypothetical protein
LVAGPLRKVNIQKPTAKQKRKTKWETSKKYRAQTVGGVMTCVMFWAFWLFDSWQLFGTWLLALLERGLSCPLKEVSRPQPLALALTLLH